MHTKGLWEYFYEGTGTWAIGQSPAPQDNPPFVTVDDSNDERALANVRLIAAAPELLEALEQAAGYLEFVRDCDPKKFILADKLAKEARAAIRKAKGE